MPEMSQRATIYFDPAIHKAVRLKAAEENRSISEIVNEAVSLLAQEDAEDITDLDSRLAERSVGYADFVKSLKADGII